MGQVAVDLKETKSILEAFDMSKPRSIVQEFAGQMHKRLQDAFPGLIAEIRETDSYGHGDIAYEIVVRGNIEEIKDFLYDEELKLAIKHGITVLNFVSSDRAA